jgi:hypothetical protein
VLDVEPGTMINNNPPVWFWIIRMKYLFFRLNLDVKILMSGELKKVDGG